MAMVSFAHHQIVTSNSELFVYKPWIVDSFPGVPPEKAHASAPLKRLSGVQPTDGENNNQETTVDGGPDMRTVQHTQYIPPEKPDQPIGSNPAPVEQETLNVGQGDLEQSQAFSEVKNNAAPDLELDVEGSTDLEGDRDLDGCHGDDLGRPRQVEECADTDYIKCLGRGTFGSVYLIEINGQLFAVKKIKVSFN